MEEIEIVDGARQAPSFLCNDKGGWVLLDVCPIHITHRLEVEELWVNPNTNAQEIVIRRF